jgi:murein DD-endopeptidase MepM/ murein hydrolase activator NlpD
MFASVGTPVVAVADGVVVRVDRVDSSGPHGEGDLGGVTVSYVTSSGDRWYNAHLSAVTAGLRVGALVQPGQIIGAVGKSGNAKTTPAHLHIEWHPAGGPARDSYPKLRAACGK